MNTVQVGNITRQLPAAWNELASKQLLFIASLLHTEITVAEFRVKVLHRIMKVKTRLFKRLNPEDVYFLTETLEFLTKDVRLTKQLLPKIGRYYGPDDSMMSCTFGEFTKAHHRFESWQKTKDEKYLNELAAILYRPKKFGWFIRKHFTESTDCRVQYLDRTLDKRSNILSCRAKETKYAVYLYFSGCLGALPDQFPHVFKKKSDEGNDSGWIGVILSLADGKTDNESIDKVMNSNLYNVFFGMEEKAKQYEKDKEALDNIKKDG
jgi:hypothetical protein